MMRLSCVCGLAWVVASSAVCPPGENHECEGDEASFLQTPGEVQKTRAGKVADISLLSVASTESAEADTVDDVSVATDSVTGDASKTKEEAAVDIKAILAEFLAMTLFVIIGCGSAMALCHEPAWLLQVSLAFGLAITTLAYTIGHYSGGQINCAVTLGLVVTGNLSVTQGLLNFCGQMVGSVLGALILYAIFGEERDKTGGLGTNSVALPEGKDASVGRVMLGALIGEFVMTFLLVYVVLETAKNPATASAIGHNAPIAIGFAVFLAHCMLIPIDGCSINPTRSFGPMLVRQACYKNRGSWVDHWVFWLGPLAGAAAAGGIYTAMKAGEHM